MTELSTSIDVRAEYSRSRFWLALTTALTTLPLIFMGGLVTSRDAGMAVPDWPGTFGYNMFTFPWSKMVGDVFYEHGHRLIGSVVGLLTITLTVWTAVTETRSRVKLLTYLALVAVCVQGLMGGLRVTMTQSETFGPYVMGFAIFHGIFAQAFLVLIFLIVWMHSKSWLQAPKPQTHTNAEIVQRMTLTLVAVTAVQLLLGAILRHTGRLAHAHIFMAVAVLATVAQVYRTIHRELPRQSRFTGFVNGLVVLLGAQVLLGSLAFLALPEMGYFRNSSMILFGVPTLHQVTGAFILVVASFLAIQCQRLLTLEELDAEAPTTETKTEDSKVLALVEGS